VVERVGSGRRCALQNIFRAIPKELVRLTRRRECQLQLNPKSLLTGPRRSVGRGKMSLCALFGPVSDASLQHKNCLGREFGKRPLPVTVSLSQSHGALAFPTSPPSPTRKPAHRGYLIPCSRARISEMRRTKIYGTGTVNYQHWPWRSYAAFE
jgi:hypothetical protein